MGMSTPASTLRGEDMAFLAQLLAPGDRPLIATGDMEDRLREAGFVVRIYGTLNATARGIELVDEMYRLRCAALFPDAAGEAPRDG